MGLIDDRNRKFTRIAEDAQNVAALAQEVAVLFREAVFDGVTAYRETRIKGATKQMEAGARRLRQHVQTYKPELLSKCETCGHMIWRDD